MKWAFVEDVTDDLVGKFTGHTATQVAKKFFKYLRRNNKEMVSHDFRFVNLTTRRVYHYLVWCKHAETQETFMGFRKDMKYFCKRLD